MAETPGTGSKSDIRLPLIGEVSKKAAAVTGVVAGGVLGYAYYRHARGGSAASTAASGTAAAGMVTDPAGNTCAALDPSSGYCPGTSQDLAYQDQQDGSSGLGGSDIDPETGYQYGSAADEAALAELNGGSAGTSGSSGTSGSGSTVTTNAEWEQEAITNLEAGGVAQATITAAESGLPRYLAKLSLSSAQATAVQLAVGLTGDPPVGGPYAIIRAPATPPKEGGTPPVSVTVPKVTGKHGEDAKDALQKAGFKVLQDPATTPRGKTTTVTSQNPAGGTKAAKGSTVSIAVTTSAAGGVVNPGGPIQRT